MNKIRVVKDRMILDSIHVRKMEYKEFFISVEEDYIGLTTAIRACNRDKSIEVKQFCSNREKFPVSIRVNTEMSLEDLDLFLQDLETAKEIAKMIEEKSDVFFSPKSKEEGNELGNV